MKEKSHLNITFMAIKTSLNQNIASFHKQHVESDHEKKNPFKCYFCGHGKQAQFMKLKTIHL